MSPGAECGRNPLAEKSCVEPPRAHQEFIRATSYVLVCQGIGAIISYETAEEAGDSMQKRALARAVAAHQKHDIEWLSARGVDQIEVCLPEGAEVAHLDMGQFHGRTPLGF
jgi:hypothetical protein